MEYKRGGTNKYGNNKTGTKKDWVNKNGASKSGSYPSDKPLSEKQIEIVNKYAPQEIKDAVQNGKYGMGRKWLDDWFSKKKSK